MITIPPSPVEQEKIARLQASLTDFVSQNQGHLMSAAANPALKPCIDAIHAYTASDGSAIDMLFPLADFSAALAKLDKEYSTSKPVKAVPSQSIVRAFQKHWDLNDPNEQGPDFFIKDLIGYKLRASAMNCIENFLAKHEANLTSIQRHLEDIPFADQKNNPGAVLTKFLDNVIPIRKATKPANMLVLYLGRPQARQELLEATKMFEGLRNAIGNLVGMHNGTPTSALKGFDSDKPLLELNAAYEGWKKDVAPLLEKLAQTIPVAKESARGQI
jgi:hypothetical protein